MAYVTHIMTDEEKTQSHKNLVLPKGRYAATCVEVLQPKAYRGNDKWEGQERGQVKVTFRWQVDGYEEIIISQANIPWNFDACNIREWLGDEEKKNVPDEMMAKYSLPLRPPDGKLSGHKLYAIGRALGLFYADPRNPKIELFDIARAVGKRAWLVCAPRIDAATQQASGTNVNAIEFDASLPPAPVAATIQTKEGKAPITASGQDEPLIAYFQAMAKLVSNRKFLTRAEMASTLAQLTPLPADGKPPSTPPTYRELPRDKQIEMLNYVVRAAIDKDLKTSEYPPIENYNLDWVRMVLPHLIPEEELEF